MKLKSNINNSLILVSGLALLFQLNACSPGYCPGNGRCKGEDFSMFDENGKPIVKKGKRKNESGLVKKKEPKKIHRKTNLRLE